MTRDPREVLREAHEARQHLMHVLTIGRGLGHIEDAVAHLQEAINNVARAFLKLGAECARGDAEPPDYLPPERKP